MSNTRAEELFNDLEQHYSDVIDQMYKEFTSHDFIKKLSQLHQDLYAQVLNEYSQNRQPFQSVHISKLLLPKTQEEFECVVRRVESLRRGKSRVV